MSFHELPIYGPPSELAARAAIAAGFQGAHSAFHHRLMGSPVVPTRAYLLKLAEDAGIDTARLLSDMQRPEVDRRLATTRALADLFGFVGTPALVVGRTAALGRVSKHTLDELVDLERNERAPLSC
ncbi:DsbA family protein [Poseidonocella pacifica]|uniref:DsbA family protein n=1 Tax=Poseidonocella pacifica TaxID=871651 RepID=UPI003CCC23C5